MAVLPVVKFGDPILRKKTEPVTNIQDAVALADDMFDTMYEEAGMGLAANQIGMSLNFMVVDISQVEEQDGRPLIIINAKILETRGQADMEEGCLSIPDIRATITRPAEIALGYLDEDGKAQEDSFDGLLARVIQHEVDHLNGVFFTDYLTPAKRSLINKRLTEISETGAPSTGIIL